MADIPVERKRGGVPMYVWLIAVVGFVVLIWAVWGRSTPGAEAHQDEAAFHDPAGTTTPGSIHGGTPHDERMMAGTITDLSTLYTISGRSGADVGRMIGREVNLEQARVVEIVNEHSFWVGEPGSTNRILVVRGDNDDSLRNVREGQTVHVRGELKRMHPWNEGDARGTLSDAHRDHIGTHHVYIETYGGAR
jgi:hypothetical protein